MCICIYVYTYVYIYISNIYIYIYIYLAFIYRERYIVFLYSVESNYPKTQQKHTTRLIYFNKEQAHK